jgi:pyridoxamine 5'-phosphate oxidase-like protein
MNLGDARRTFQEVPVAHVGSILPDGSPHVVPLWFVWLEDAVFVSCREGSRVHRNLQLEPRTVLAFDRGRDWPDQAGVLVHGRAEFLPEDHPALRRALSAWFEKYRGELAGSGFAAYAEQVRSPAVFRVRPERLASWDHARRPPPAS